MIAPTIRRVAGWVSAAGGLALITGSFLPWVWSAGCCESGPASFVPFSDESGGWTLAFSGVLAVGAGTLLVILGPGMRRVTLTAIGALTLFVAAWSWLVWTGFQPGSTFEPGTYRLLAGYTVLAVGSVACLVGSALAFTGALAPARPERRLR